jgi:hypothetical protein
MKGRISISAAFYLHDEPTVAFADVLQRVTEPDF